MRVTIKPNGGKEFEIAGLGDRVVTSVIDYEETPVRDIQIVKFFRGKFRKVFDRGNIGVEITFSVARLHPDVRDAEVYMIEHAQTIPAQGLLTMTMIGANGRRAERYAVDAVVTPTKIKHGGCTSFHSYQIFCGEILTKKPLPT